MKIELTASEKTALLKEVLTGTIETDNFKRLFKQDREQPLFCTCNDSGVFLNCEKCKNGSVICKDVKQTDEELKRDVKELLRKCDGLL